MPACWVIYCKSGYSSHCNEKIPMFEPPKDPEGFARWVKAIPKRERKLSAKSPICAKHFQEKDILWYWTSGEGDKQVKVRLSKPKLVPNAVPSVFDNCPSSCVPRVQKARKPPKIRTTTVSSRRRKPVNLLQSLPSENLEKSAICDTFPSNKTLCEEYDESLKVSLPSTSKRFSASNTLSNSVSNESEVDEMRSEYFSAQSPLPSSVTNEGEICQLGSSETNPDSTAHEMLSSFHVWDQFDLLESVLQVPVVILCDESKCLAEMTLSQHIVPRLRARKEIRSTKENNEVQCFIMDEAFGVPTVVSSAEELTNFATEFFTSKFCCGLPPDPDFKNAKKIKTGYINVLNRWQSVHCQKKIEMPEWTICLCCDKLRRALLLQAYRRDDVTRGNSTNYGGIKKKLFGTPEKKLFARRRVKNITKAKTRLQNANAKLREENRIYKEKLEKLTDETIENYIKRRNIVPAQAMVLQEIINIAKYHSKFSRRYSTDWMLACLLMSIRGPDMYKFLLQNDILPLPSLRTIKRRLSSIKIGCGFDPCFFKAFAKKLETKTPEQKYGILVFDEMTVRKSLKTNVKTMRYQGVVDFGDEKVSCTDENELADHALVFGFSLLGENYFQPLGCFASKGPTKGVTLAKLILQATLLLEKAGAKVTAIICDGASTNRKMWQQFGVCGKLGSSKHYFANPYDDARKIFVISDMPHIFKCIRNRLIKKELMTRFGWVRWRHYQVLYDEDTKLEGKVRLCPRITKAHVNPCSFARMRVSYMTQIFSRSVAVALNKYRERLTEELEDSEPTEKFSRYMNDLFDALNRRYPAEGITPQSPDLDIIREGITFLDEWESEVKNGTISKDAFLTDETAEGLRVTLHSTLDLIEFLHNVGYKYVLTAKINQDRLEQFFGIIRQAGAQNDHPAMPTFLQLYRLLSLYKLVKPPKFGNCLIENDIAPDRAPDPPISMNDIKLIFSTDPSESAVAQLRSQLDSLVEQADWDEEELLTAISDCGNELEDIAIYCACGYLCRRLLKRTKCSTCREAFLTKLDTSDLAVADLVNAKTKGFLLYCNLYLYDIFRNTENFFVKNVTSSDCYERTLTDVFENVNLTFPCTEHKSDILAIALHYYVLMRMRHYERETTRALKKKSFVPKKVAKLHTS